MIRAVIFDLDGTLADTEPLHFAAFAEVLATEGIELTRVEYFTRLIGYNDHDCFEAVLAENHRPAGEDKIRTLVERKARVYQHMIENRDVLYPGAADFVRRCAERFPLLVVTGTLRAEAEMILGRAGLRALFLDVIAAEDVEHGKPEPDGFVLALGRLGFLLRQRPPIDPSECLVVEDTHAGVESARRAGMRVLALMHSAPEDELSGADVIRASFADTDLDEVLRLLAK
jgi:HAD superfamily hydrolase (TIGR01509 family)